MIKSIYIRNLMMDIWKKKKLVIGCTIGCTLLLALFGYKGASTEIAPENLAKLSEYNTALEEYEKILRELNESISLAEEQVKNSQDYCDNSIYMKLDSQNIQMATIQYAIKDTGNVGYTLNAWTAYINDGSLREEVSKALPDFPLEYLKEIISCHTSGNVLVVSVMHYDSEKAQQLIQQIDTQLLQHRDAIAAVQGAFNMEKLNSSSYTRADSGIMNTQNSNLNNLKNYKSNLSDFQKKLIDQTTSRSNYIKNNEPENLNPASPVSSACKYGIFGIFVGLVLSCAALTIKFIVGDCVKDYTDLLNAGLPVISRINHGASVPEISRCAVDISLLASQSDSHTVFFSTLSEKEASKKVFDDFVKPLKQLDLSPVIGFSVHDKIDDLKQMIDAGNCILIIEAGKTRYAQLEDQVQLCKKFGISIWGCIIIE